MSQSILIVVHRSNTAVVFSPPPTDGSQAVHGPLAAGQSILVERGNFLDNAVQVDIWDWDDYQAFLVAPEQP